MYHLLFIIICEISLVHNMMLDERYVDTGMESRSIPINVTVASKGQNTHAFDRNAELASHCEPAFRMFCMRPHLCHDFPLSAN